MSVTHCGAAVKRDPSWQSGSLLVALMLTQPLLHEQASLPSNDCIYTELLLSHTHARITLSVTVDDLTADLQGLQVQKPPGCVAFD